MTTKVDLHQLIDALPDWILPEAERFLRDLEADAAAPYIPPDQAPLVEPEEDELEALAEGRPTLADCVAFTEDELDRALGL